MEFYQMPMFNKVLMNHLRLGEISRLNANFSKRF